MCTRNRSLILIEALESRRLLTHPLGDAFTVSQSRADGNGNQLDVAADADGDFVAVWVSSGTDGGVRETRGRLYDRFGQPRGDEQRFLGGDRFPRVAMDASGDFVIVVEGSGRVFDSDGAPVGSAFPVGLNPDVAMEDNGDFVAVWHDLDDGIIAQRFEADGTPIGGQITVEPSTGTADNFLIFPAVAMDANGDFVVVWMQGQQQGFKRVRARRYNNAGTALGGAFNVTPDPIDSFLVHPRVSMDDVGAFAITWPQNGTGSGREVFVRRYDSAGAAQGVAFQINNDTDGDQDSPDIAMDDDGDFVVVWADESDPPQLTTARRFSSAGVAEANEFTVDIINPFDHFDISVAAEDNGTFIAVWKMFLGSELGIQVRARRFTPDETAPAAPSRPDLAASSDTGQSATDNITRDATPAFLGTAEPGAIVTLLVDGVAAATGTASSNGVYTIGVPASFNLADGVHSFAVTATDDGPNTSPPSQSLIVTIDTTAVAAAPDLTSSSDTGISNTDNITADTQPTFTGTSEPGAIIKVFANGVDVSTTSFAQLGMIWSMTVSQLTDGVKSIAVTQEDIAGNVSAPSPILTITIDTIPPGNPTVPPDLAAASDTGVSSTDNLTNDNTPLLIGAVFPNAIVRLFEGTIERGLDSSTSSGSYAITSSALGDGSRSLSVRFEDLAGNQSASSPALSITIDTLPPDAPTAAPDLDQSSDTGTSSSDNLTRDNTPSFEGNVPAGAFVRLFADTVEVGFTTSTSGGKYAITSTRLPDGPTSMTTRFEDAAGNQSSSGPSLLVTIDTLAPAVSGRAFEFLTRQAVRFSFTENVGPTLSVADLTLENLTSGTTIPAGSIAFSYASNTGTFTFPGFAHGILPDGDYRATLTAAGVTDLAGNALASNSILEFFVLAGDANRDRKLNIADYLRIDRGFLRGLSGFSNGDFDYSGLIDGNDYFIIDQAYLAGLGVAAARSAESAPTLAPMTVRFSQTQIGASLDDPESDNFLASKMTVLS